MGSMPAPTGSSLHRPHFRNTPVSDSCRCGRISRSKGVQCWRSLRHRGDRSVQRRVRGSPHQPCPVFGGGGRELCRCRRRGGDRYWECVGVSGMAAGLLRTPATTPGAASSAGLGLPTRSDIEGWTDAIDVLSTSAAAYRAAAERIESAADAHVQQMSAPGGAVWAGDAADVARESGYADRGVIYRAADHLRDLAKIANLGAQNLGQARDRALDEISEPEGDDFQVGDDLTVTDTRRYTSREIDMYTSRKTKAEEHHRYIAMRAGALASDDAEVGAKLQAGAAALEAMIPPHWSTSGETPVGTIQAVDYTRQPEKPPPKPGDPVQPFSVRNAEDVHRIVDPLPPGKHPGVKTLPTPAAIQALYGQLTENSVPGPPSTYPGQWRVLEDGTKIGLRQTSKFGGPTVEIWYPNGTKTDVHLPERPKGPAPNPVPVPAPAPVPLPAPEPSPDPVPDGPALPELGPQPVVTPEEGGVIAVIGGIGIAIVAGMVELGKLVLSP